MAVPLYANNAELNEILQTLIPEKTFLDPLLTKILPVRSVEEQEVMADQRAGFYGATQGRDYGTGFGTVPRETKQRFAVPIGLYGEDKPMDEKFVMQSRKIGTFADVLDLRKEQGSDMENLLDRMIKLMLSTGWSMLTTGSYTNYGPDGKTVIASDSYTLGSFTVAVAWSNFASSTPMADLRNIKLKHRGQSATFGRRGQLYLQTQDVNNLLQNTNANDLGAKRVITVDAGAQPFTLADVNRYLLEADLMEIVEYDKFLPTSAASWSAGPSSYTMYIPYQTGVAVGARDYGDPLGHMVMTPTFGSLLEMRDDSVPDIRSMPDNPWANIYFDFWKDRRGWQFVSRIAANLGVQIDFPSAFLIVNTN